MTLLSFLNLLLVAIPLIYLVWRVNNKSAAKTAAILLTVAVVNWAVGYGLRLTPKFEPICPTALDNPQQLQMEAVTNPACSKKLYRYKNSPFGVVDESPGIVRRLSTGWTLGWINLALLGLEQGLYYRPTESFSMWPHLTGYEQYADYFVYAESLEEMDAIKARIDFILMEQKIANSE